MSEEMNLVKDLALILVSAGIMTIISKALKQPLILGYILAGFFIGPNFRFFFGISSIDAVNQWSEIGIIFLMFGLGLEFSFKKLMKVGAGALVTAGCKFIGVFVLGFVVGKAMLWTTMESIFLAGLLSMSSTMVVVKSYNDMGLKNKPYAGIVFGTLVVEDLFAILLMVLLSTLAVSKKFSGGELALNFCKLAFFIILWFLIGIYVIPTLLKKTRKYLNDEILLIVSIGLCLGMVTIATTAGFSSALGAFVMGSILAETTESEHISTLVGPIKDLFGAIFFVSVGMMLAPAVIMQYWWIILIIAVLVVISHIIFSAFGIIISGHGMENAVHTGFSLAQLGEFGFIIAGVGCTLGVMRSFIYPVIIAVSVITTFTTPYMIRLADPAYSMLRRRLPANVLGRIDQMERKSAHSTAEQSEWKKLLKAYITRIVLYSVIIIAIFTGFKFYIEPLVSRMFPAWTAQFHNFVVTIAELLVMSPFLYGLGVGTGSINAPVRKLLKEKANNAWAILGLAIIRAFIAIGFIMAVISTHINLEGWVIVALLFAGLLLILSSRHFLRKYSAVEERFLSNLNEKEEIARKNAPVSSALNRQLSGYDVHTESVIVSQDSSFIGQKLKDLPIRSETGALIIKIQRGSHNYVIPSGKFVIYPCDKLLAVGTNRQIADLKKIFNDSETPSDPSESDKEFDVLRFTLAEDSFLTGKTLESAGIRDYHCLVISVLRGSEFIPTPKSDFKFETGDTVWLAGETSSCNWLK